MAIGRWEWSYLLIFKKSRQIKKGFVDNSRNFKQSLKKYYFM